MKDLLEEKTILVTGGTGFLGNCLVEELLKHDIKSVRVFSRDEVKHHEMEERFNRDERLRNFVGDVRDFNRLNQAVKGSDIVIHAAAMKRIDMIEYNVMEAVKTNVFGTMNVVKSCLENDVEKAVFVSTDKACSPINSYGATKMLGERIFIESNYSKGKAKTALVSVRYGNVLESTGSVIPFFVNKIKNNEKIPLTDERMTRFIITPKQAVKLIFDAVKDGVGGEVFVPKLQSIKIADLIEVLQQNFGGKGNVELTGVRPGEKIHEVLLNEEECQRAFEMEGNYVVLSQIDRYHDFIKYPYLQGKKAISLCSYSSKDFLVESKQLGKILADEGILP